MNPIKALHEAQNSAGDQAVRHAMAGTYAHANAWRDVAIKCTKLMAEAAKLRYRP